MGRVRNGIRLLSGSGQPLEASRRIRIDVKSARVQADEADQRARDPFLIQWGNVAFDPMKGTPVPAGVPAELASPARALPRAMAQVPDDVDYWIVQFEGSSSDASEAFAATGAAVLAYVPNNAYLVRADGVQLRQIQVEPMVRWTGRNLPAWKLDERALALIADDADPALLPVDPMGLVRVALRVHPGLAEEQLAAYYETLKALPGTQMLNTGMGEDSDLGRRFLLGLDPSVVRDTVVQLASLRDVSTIWSAEIPVLHDDHAVWFMQSGNDTTRADDYGLTAPLFAKGITGRGLIGTVADDGLENDMCFFRYTGQKNDAAWVQGPSAAPAPGVPDELSLDLAAATPAVRTRDRKVVAYYVQGGAAAYSSPLQHGTAVSGVMVADNNVYLAARPLVRDLGERQNVRFWQTGGVWTPGQELRSDLIAAGRVDVIGAADNEPTIPDTYGSSIEHHQAKDGMAPGAQLIMQDIGNANGDLTFTVSIQALYEQASRTGATVHNSSFGGGDCPACYVGDGQDADSAMWYRRDLLGFVSAGNNGIDPGGPSTIGAGHAHAKSVMTVGWSTQANQPSCPPCPVSNTPRLGQGIDQASSKGPKAGGMLAPEIVATGTVRSVAASDDPTPNPETGSGTSDGGCGSVSPAIIGGTSFASPIAAGAGLLVQQYFWDGFYPSGIPTPEDALRPTNALVRAILVNSARNMEGSRTDDTGIGQAPRPSFGQGWGAPRLDDTLYFENDPKRIAGFETERARLAVLNDAPNGFDGTFPLAPEPGGKTRDEIVKNFNPGLQNLGIHPYYLRIVNDSNGDTLPDLDDLANELRVTLAWSDPAGATNAAPQVNNLDLEVVSPGANGLLETDDVSGVRGDDVVYRPKPNNLNWQNGYTQPSPDDEITTASNILDVPWDDTDLLNTVENVFIRPQDVVSGTYMIRVVARRINGVNGTSAGYPNYALDQSFTRDTDGDGVDDVDEFDTIRQNVQGYALVVSGNFTTDQGLLAMNKSQFGCEGESLTLALNDENGGDVEAPCTDPTLGAMITTTTPNPAFPEDREPVQFNGSAPTYRSVNPVTGTESFDVVLVRNPRDVVHGDGIIQVAHGETIIARYDDRAPCGGRAFAQANISCQPSVADQGFIITNGCDYADPGNPAGGSRPDEFMDVGELNTYTVSLVNTGSFGLTDAIVSLYPDPADPEALDVQVLDSPRYIGSLVPGRISDVAFLVQVGDVPPRHQMDFIIEVVSPRDGLLFPATFRQTQIMEADVVSFRYDTRDPDGQLYRKGRIEILKPGVEELPGGSNPASDYVTNEPMWWDPDANDPALCDVGRENWPDPFTPPPGCTPNSNPISPWDFDDSDDGFYEVAFDGDSVSMGPDFDPLWNWKAAPGGGGCGWEDELHEQLASGSDPLPPGPAGRHPDLIARPWGIWHTGEINKGLTTQGPLAGNLTDNQGMPFYDNPTSPNDHTIIWDPPATPNDNNANGDWCQTYYSNPSLGDGIYRSMLLAPTLYRVHATNPDYRVEFQSFTWYSRLDAHTRNPNNLAALGWFINNQPVPPSTVTPDSRSWSQYQYYTNIYSDKVRNDWGVDDNTLGEGNLAHPNEDFPYLTYEDIFGTAADSWNVAFGWSHFHLDGYPSRKQYGAGIDDVSFVWTESRDDIDRSDCGALVGGQRPIIWFGENRYNACEGTLRINLWAPAETRNPIAVAVRSAAEDYETALLYFNAATGRYEGEMEYTSDTRDDAVGVLLSSSGLIDIGNGADQISVEYDPETTDNEDRPGQSLGLDADPATDPQVRADWCDDDLNEINDDNDGNGVADCEDDRFSEREVRDFSVINCTSGRLYYIKHELQQVGAGDNDRFADPGETHRMKVYLVSDVGADLSDVEVKVSTDDPICLINDTLTLGSLPGNGTIVDTDFGFEFAVPLGMQTTNLANPATVTFRIDVRGLNTTNLNEFSTAGESFNSFLPLEAWLLVDVDARATNPDYLDTVQAPVPPAGTFFEGFNGDQLTADGLDHYPASGFQPGLRGSPSYPLRNDTTADTRYGMSGNSGFCPECDVQDDCSVVDDVCDHYFSNDPAFMPGYDLSLDPPWSPTADWRHEGRGAYKFGQLNAPPDVDDQHYPQGVYASLQLPPLRLSSTFPQPEMTFWHIANIWGPFFTNGLFTPIDGFVVEVSPSAIGVGDTGAGPDNFNRSDFTRIDGRYPLSSFRRVSPYEGLYDWETDALNACRALFCRYKHPVFAFQGSPTVSPASATDPERGMPGTPGTWKLAKIDLSDFRGMEVVIQFSAEVLQDLEVQNGSLGWFLDQVTVTGVSNRVAIQVQTANLTVEPCGITAEFEAVEPECHGDDVQFYDRHTGVGSFDPGTGDPYPLEYEWRVGGLILTGFAGDLIAPPQTGVFGTYENPRINLRTSAAAIASPGRVPVTLTIRQNGVPVSVTHSIVYKDAPVPVLNAVAAAYTGGSTQMSATATFNTALDADRTLYWEWDFGDGTGTDASGASVEHVYDTAGTYTVTVRVYDEEGCVGTDTMQVTVTAAPFFERPIVAPAADPDCGAPFGADNNADIEELVTVGIDFANAPGAAAATGVIGYLTSPDEFVEIVTGVADFGGPITGGSRSGIRNFRFIRHDDGSGIAPTCLVVPLQLTLVANGGSIIQVLDLSFTMGLASEVSFDNAGNQTGSFTREADGYSEDVELYTGVPAGCLTGLELNIELQAPAPGQSVVADMKVDIIPPSGVPVTVQYPTGPNDRGPYTIHFRFGADNGGGPIPNLAGQLEDLGTLALDPGVAAGLVSQLVGQSMNPTGTDSWTVRVSSSRPGSPTSTYAFTIREFRLEGTNSGDLRVGNVLACGDACFGAGAPPVFDAPRIECPSKLVFSPANDAFTCDGISDVTYQVYASTTSGQLGTRVDGTAREVADCAACTDPNGACILPPLDGASFFEVCTTEGDPAPVFWTVVAVDGSGQRTPNISAAGDNPGIYQATPNPCIGAPIGSGVFAIVKQAQTAATLWLTPPTGVPTWAAIGPPPNADSYRVLRGTFPSSGGQLQMLGTRASPYDHVVRPGDCSFTTLTRDVSADLTLAGSYYYFVPGINNGGCAGMGEDSEGGVIPGSGTGCPTDPDCGR